MRRSRTRTEELFGLALALGGWARGFAGTYRRWVVADGSEEVDG